VGDELGGIYAITEEKKEPVRLWNLREPVLTMVVDRSGEWIAIGVGRPSRKEIYRRTSLGKPWRRPAGAPEPIRVLPMRVLLGGTGQGIPPDQRTITLPGPAGGTHAVGFSSDGSRLAAGGADGTLHLWWILEDKARVLR